jgi:hypothetical protein
MFKIFGNANEIVDTPAAKPSSIGKTVGWFRVRNISLGKLPTKIYCWWMNMVQAELLSALTACGITPNESSDGQLGDCFNKKANRAGDTFTGAVTFNGNINSNAQATFGYMQTSQGGGTFTRATSFNVRPTFGAEFGTSGPVGRDDQALELRGRVRARYYLATQQEIPDDDEWMTVNFNGSSSPRGHDYPTPARVTTGANWVFTADRDMTVRVSATVVYVFGIAPGKRAELMVRRYDNRPAHEHWDNYALLDSRRLSETYNHVLVLHGTTNVFLFAGDKIDVQTHHDDEDPHNLDVTYGAVPLDNPTFIEIEEI